MTLEETLSDTFLDRYEAAKGVQDSSYQLITGVSTHLSAAVMLDWILTLDNDKMVAA